MDVEPRSSPGEVIVFGGELLSWLTRDEIRPLLHRVVAVTHDGKDVGSNRRLSFPFFQVHPYFCTFVKYIGRVSFLFCQVHQ